MGGWQNGSGVLFAALNIDGWKTAHTTNEQGNYRRELSPSMHIIDPFKSSYGIPPRAAFVSPGRQQAWISSPKRVIALGKGRM